VFVPVFFLEGLGKFLFGPLALAVTFAMLASYVIALTVVPIYARRFLGGDAASGAAHGGAEDGATHGALSRLYRRVLGITVTRPVIAAVLAVAAVGGAVLVVPTLGSELFPRSGGASMSMLVR
jgi:HAE1 family hydrophobic/amphiphilic exporter-1